MAQISLLLGVIVAYVAILAIIYFSFKQGKSQRAAEQKRQTIKQEEDMKQDDDEGPGDVDSITSEEYVELEREAISSSSSSSLSPNSNSPPSSPPLALVRASSADFRAQPQKKLQFARHMSMTPGAPYERATLDDVAESVNGGRRRVQGEEEPLGMVVREAGRQRGGGVGQRETSSVSKLADSIERAMSAPPIRHQRSFREKVELDKILHGVGADEQKLGRVSYREFPASSIEIEEAPHRVPIDKVQHAMMLAENSPGHVVYPTEDATYGQEAYEASNDYRNGAPKTLAKMSPEDRIMAAHIQKLV